MKLVKVLVVALVMAWYPSQASAGDYEVQNVMDDALYGGGIGAVVGLGLMLLTKKPTDNWNYVSRGLGGGLIVGSIYGIYRTSKSLAQIEDGQIHFGLPTPEVAFQDTPKGLDMVVVTPLIAGHF
ncbi:MAG: hypothetical protein R8M14_04030 [Ghiorsea sp.]